MVDDVPRGFGLRERGLHNSICFMLVVTHMKLTEPKYGQIATKHLQVGPPKNIKHVSKVYAPHLKILSFQILAVQKEFKVH